MIQIRRSAIVRQTPEVMFDLVSEVEAYPRRFPWCAGSAVFDRDEAALSARLDVRLAGITQSFTTRNTLVRPQRLHMHLLDGPFRTLEGELGFQNLADRMVDDFCREARLVGA